ncbi:MAG: DUF4197 domain-containing protein [Geminicoccaceae bacterium]
MGEDLDLNLPRRRALVGGLALGVMIVDGAKAQQDLLGKITKGVGSITGDQGGGSGLGTDEIAAGLKEALRVGSERVVGQLGTEDGFNKDPRFHIPLPGPMAKAQSALQLAGLSGMADDLELKLNRAAEEATPVAQDLFIDAIAGLTFSDVQEIYQGPNDAATQYLARTTGPGIADAMRPIVGDALQQVGAIQTYDALVADFKQVPLVPDISSDLNDHVLGYAHDAIFGYLAEEEAAIRTNPAERSTELLKRVFSN